MSIGLWILIGVGILVVVSLPALSFVSGGIKEAVLKIVKERMSAKIDSYIAEQVGEALTEIPDFEQKIKSKLRTGILDKSDVLVESLDKDDFHALLQLTKWAKETL